MAFLSALLGLLGALLSRQHLALENLALRQQLAVLRRQVSRPRLRATDRLFWVALSRAWAGWREALCLVKPDAVVAWHRAGFRLFWRWRSGRGGRPEASAEVRAPEFVTNFSGRAERPVLSVGWRLLDAQSDSGRGPPAVAGPAAVPPGNARRGPASLRVGPRSTAAIVTNSGALISRLATDNPLWGAPRVHGEMLKLGIRVAQSTVARWMPKRPRPGKPPSQTWRTFLRNHLFQAVAMDFFVIPTVSFRLLYGFVILEHGRRRICHVAVTSSPSAEWVSQQLREAFAYDEAPRFLHRDRDGIYGKAVVATLEAMGIEDVPSAPRSPWQNPYCERVIGTLRGELLDRVIVFGEAHALRLLREYVAYYNGSRTHLSLFKDAPVERAVEPPSAGVVHAREVLGGLHHRYFRRAA